MRDVVFHFDYISPFAYLASQSLARLDGLARVTFRPLLFAGLLAHWETRGPAEIVPMRRFTYRHIRWLAGRHGIPLQFPPAHPFNPLPLLRLTLACGSAAAVVDRLFRFVWAEGRSSEDAAAFAALCAELGVDAVALADPALKLELRRNGEQALAAGVFGVPAYVVDGELFWGFDALDFLADYLRDPGLLESPGMRAADALPVGRARVPFGGAEPG
ncbi:MAG TPA: 2-hydroxychromene-2-carboxylate isomerase [Gammaproteobacteria bacterium]